MAQISERAGLEGVVAAATETRRRGPPPVHLWDPPDRGDIDIVIRRDGTWVHEGGVIGREALVRLFSSILRREAGGTYLVTPVEKWRVQVEDAPFVAVRVDRVADSLRFLTNVGDEVTAGPEHPIRLEPGSADGPRPYLLVRHGLDALISRPVFYELIDLAQERATPQGPVLGLESAGAWFPLAAPGAHRP